VASYAAGLLAKSTAVCVPAALLLWEAGASRLRAPAAAGRWPLWRGHLAYWAIAAAYLLGTGNLVTAAVGHPVRSLWVNALTQLKAATYYPWLLAMPVRLSVEHPFAEAPGLVAASVLLPAALLGSGVATAARLSQRSRDAGTAAMLLGWALLAMLPSSLVPLNVLVNEHRLYPALALAAPALGLLLARGVGGPRRLAVGAAILLVLGALTYQRNRVWLDELTLWQDAVAKGPAMYRGHLHLGGALEAAGDLAGALSHYEEAARLAPRAVEAHYNLGNALRRVGRAPEAAGAYARCLDLNPGYVPAILNLAGMALEAGDPARAEELLNRAARVPLGPVQRPSVAAAHYNLANLYFGKGEWSLATAHYEQALRLAPGHADARYNLGDLHLGQGRLQAAEAVFAEGLRQNPEVPKFWYGMARAQEALGQRAEALGSYQRFLPYTGHNLQVEEFVRSRIRDLAGSVE
jgi:tetratricopeptide (TPR) repeat protein